MLAALEALRADFDFAVEVLDVDADEALLARYDELVPVLIGRREGQPERQLCHYFLDQSAVQDFLA